MHSPITLVDSSRSQTLTIEPAAGCVATSWRVGDREMIALPSPREEFLRSARTGGIPLLYPYANRLRGDHFEVADRAVNLAVDAKLKRDPTGLPIHGLLLRWGDWIIAQPSQHTLEASIRWADHPSLMAAYPFAHTVRVLWQLARDDAHATLSITTVIEADQAQAVPVAFGWHPYLALDAKKGAKLQLPRRRPIKLAPTGLPMLPAAHEPWIEASQETTGANQDALFEVADVDQPVCIALVDGTERTEILFQDGYRFLQIYSPTGQPFTCAEPMTAATASLNDAPTTIAAGERMTASFQMRKALR